MEFEIQTCNTAKSLKDPDTHHADLLGERRIKTPVPYEHFSECSHGP